MDFLADDFEQAGVVSVEALEEEQQRFMPAPFESVADRADLLQAAVRVPHASSKSACAGVLFILANPPIDKPHLRRPRTAQNLVSKRLATIGFGEAIALIL